MTALIVYLYVGQFLSTKRTAQAIADLFGVAVSEGTVATTTKRAADTLGEFAEQIRQRITNAEVAHVDETGFAGRRAAGVAALGLHRGSIRW